MSQQLRPPRWARFWGEDAIGVWATLCIRGVEQRFRLIPSGTFLMGSPEGEKDRRDNEVQHLVHISEGFWLAETTVTQELYTVIIGQNPSHFQGQTLPVERVSWHDCQDFIRELNRLTEARFGLPSEAQWEYACRAGTRTAFSFGDTIDSTQVNFNGNHPYRSKKSEYRATTIAVTSLPANPWGLYEMHGNVWEWCEDWYGAYESRSQTTPMIDPQGAVKGGDRVLRGGSWYGIGRDCRSADRDGNWPDFRYFDVGFRLLSGLAEPS